MPPPPPGTRTAPGPGTAASLSPVFYLFACLFVVWLGLGFFSLRFTRKPGCFSLAAGPQTNACPDGSAGGCPPAAPLSRPGSGGLAPAAPGRRGCDEEPAGLDVLSAAFSLPPPTFITAAPPSAARFVRSRDRPHRGGRQPGIAAPSRAPCAPPSFPRSRRSHQKGHWRGPPPPPPRPGPLPRPAAVSRAPSSPPLPSLLSPAGEERKAPGVPGQRATPEGPAGTPRQGARVAGGGEPRSFLNRLAVLRFPRQGRVRFQRRRGRCPRSPLTRNARIN